jgi:hypothetical protein
MVKHRKKRITQYFKEREINGNTQDDAELLTYGKINKHGSRIEKTEIYQECKGKYADVLKSKISLDNIAEIQIRNAVQDKDKGASNKAIESMLERIEPQEQGEIMSGDVQIIVKPRENKESEGK